MRAPYGYVNCVPVWRRTRVRATSSAYAAARRQRQGNELRVARVRAARRAKCASEQQGAAKPASLSVRVRGNVQPQARAVSNGVTRGEGGVVNMECPGHATNGFKRLDGRGIVLQPPVCRRVRGRRQNKTSPVLRKRPRVPSSQRVRRVGVGHSVHGVGVGEERR